jgi:hypothetical protein
MNERIILKEGEVPSQLKNIMTPFRNTRKSNRWIVFLTQLI